MDKWYNIIKRHHGFLPFYFIMTMGMLMSCSSSRLASSKKSVKNEIKNSTIFSQLFTGFVLYDPLQKKELININGHKYFTPASNTKILTLYTSLKVLKDSIPVLKYENRGDSFYFSGTGNPMPLNPFFSSNNQTLSQFLSNQDKILVFCNNNFDDKRFGPGWAWDDYMYSYQTERSPLPLYGSLIHIEDEMVTPPFFHDSVVFLKGNKDHKRGFNDNQFVITNPDDNFERAFPFHPTDDLVNALLSHHINRVIGHCPNDFSYLNPKVLYQKMPDSLYPFFMQESDNFIGEQLMLMNAFELYDTMNVSRSIQWAQENLFAASPDSLRWVDGSGLSRYNLFTPSSVIYVLDRILDEMGLDEIKRIFPSGSKKGTIKEFYSGVEKPYFYAKTGTLSNKHCLSGYIITKKNHWLIFSFMNNNYLGNLKEVKEEMQKILQRIYHEY